MHNQTRKLAVSSAFVALAVSAGYFLAQFPNIELITGIIFLGGYLLGWRYGLLIGFLAEGIYSTLNPYGMPALPVLLAQILGMMLTGATGGLLGSQFPDNTKKGFPIILGTTGVLLTLFYDFITTVATALLIGFSWQSFFGLLVIGGVFYFTHVLCNGLVFLILLPLILRGVGRSRPFFKEQPALDTMESTAP